MNQRDCNGNTPLHLGEKEDYRICHSCIVDSLVPRPGNEASIVECFSNWK